MIGRLSLILHTSTCSSLNWHNFERMFYVLHTFGRSDFVYFRAFIVDFAYCRSINILPGGFHWFCILFGRHPSDLTSFTAILIDYFEAIFVYFAHLWNISVSYSCFRAFFVDFAYFRWVCIHSGAARFFPSYTLNGFPLILHTFRSFFPPNFGRKLKPVETLLECVRIWPRQSRRL